MTSIAWSPMLESYIGLGFLKGGKARMGETLQAKETQGLKKRSARAYLYHCKRNKLRVVGPRG